MAPDDQSGQWLSLPMTRRAALRRGAQLAGLASVGLAAACGSSSSSSSSASSSAGTTEPLSGTVTFANYPEWIGAHEVVAFEKANPGVKIHQVSELTSGGNAAQIVQIHQNQGSYDMALAGNTASQQLADGKLIQPVDLNNIPNIKYIPSYFRKSFPWGVPTDYGKVGLGYRKDLMTETPTSWADLWDLAPKYSGKIIFTDYDVDVISVALLKLGYDINTTDEGQLEAGEAGAARHQAARSGVPANQRHQAAAEWLGGHDSRLRLRPRPSQPRQPERRVGAAEGRHAGLSRGVDRDRRYGQAA